jgi:2-dehydro-3-deoxyphosphogluconate aldolase / (4S)-4-hydroxy-2-oxoglutarate aldolase
MDVLSAILERKLVAIIRGAPPGEVHSLIESLYAGGVTLVEVTLNSDQALSLISAEASVWGDRVLIGAGTVLDAEAARSAIGAGARFIISPGFDKETIAATKAAGVVSIPGAYTPTEILAAHRFGADIVKVFPASPAYFNDLQGPLSHIRLMPTGGVTLANIRDFRGAVAYGVGSALVGGADLTGTARQFLQIIHDA